MGEWHGGEQPVVAAPSQLALERLKIGDVIEIMWLDSCGRGQWGSREEHERSVADDHSYHHSVGYFFKLTRHVLAINQSQVKFVSAPESIDSVLSVPRVALVGMKVLRRG